MALLTNALYIVQGEINCIVTEMKRSVRFPTHSIYQEDNPLVNSFTELRETLHGTTDLSDLEPCVFLGPFLELVRSEETSGRITGLALTSLNKFISYGFIDCKTTAGPVAVESIADAVTHARFVGTDPESDEVVLMKILYVLRTLLLSPCGHNLTNESVCEIMQSCFRICFESRLSKLLRRTADHILVEMVQLLFLRLPEFKEDSKWAKNMRKLKMRTGGLQKPHRKGEGRRSRSESQLSESSQGEQATPQVPSATPLPEDTDQSLNTEDQGVVTTEEDNSATDTIRLEHVLTTQFIDQENPQESPGSECDDTNTAAVTPHMVDIHEGLPEVRHDSQANLADADTTSLSSAGESEGNPETLDFINPKGVRFIPKKDGPILPYGLASIRELFRFLISIMNPQDKQNSEEMSHMGIYLLTVALETAADHLPKYASLMSLVKNELSFNLFRQLQSDRVSVFSAAMRACFLLFESMRSHLKHQLEMYLTKLMDIIVSDNLRVTYDIKEIALQGLVQLWRIPGLVTELYLNYDCDVHCSNLFEDITKLLSKVTSATETVAFSKNAFPVTGLFSTHVLSLDALLTVLESVEDHCHTRIMAAKNAGDSESDKKTQPTIGQWRKPRIKPNRMMSSSDESGVEIPPLELLHARKQQKQVYHQAVEMFNVKPKTGIAYLQEQGYLDKTNESIVAFLKETPKLNKAMLGEYLSRKDNPELTDAYMRLFDFAGLRLDEALRQLLETFRLPGESPVIEFLMEHFSGYWYEANNAPFAHPDAAFTLVYAIIMLNVDQHSTNAKKQNIPMTLHQFRKNLHKVNGDADFDQDMLAEIYHAIREEEIVLPEERTGAVKEIYEWKMLMSKSVKEKTSFIHAPTGCYDNELFSIIWGPTIAALSFVFDKSQDPSIVQKAISGFRKCAMISAHYGLSEVFDNLVISLCKFTTFLNSAEASDQIAISFAANQKAQLAAKTVFSLAHRHGDMLREGWKNILDCMMTLYRARLLPHTFTEVEDFLQPDGRIKLIKENKNDDLKNDSGVFNAFLTYFAAESGNQKGQSAEEEQAVETSKQVIDECDLDSVIDDTKFLRTSSLQELIKALISLCQISVLDGEGCQDEEMVVFFLELLIRVVLQNRDRAGVIWQNVRDHLSSIIMRSTDHTFLAERAVTGLLRLAIRLLCREEVACQVLPSLRVLLLMKATVLRSMSRQLAYGLHLLLETNAANIHSTQDWYCLFTLLEVVGAGGSTPSHHQQLDSGAMSDGEASPRANDIDSERGYTSDSELYGNTASSATSSQLTTTTSNTDLSTGTAPDPSWILVNKHKNSSLDNIPVRTGTPLSAAATAKHAPNQFSIMLNEELFPHDSKALMKCAEVLVMLVRDAAHITPYNFDSCVHAIRVFVEASMHNLAATKKRATPGKHNKKHKNKKDHGAQNKSGQKSKNRDPFGSGNISGDEDSEKTTNEYHQLSLQLLELMHTLHTRAASIFHSWAEEQKSEHEDSTSQGSGTALDGGDEDNICDDETSSLWRRCWCPLLQGIARLCTDVRRTVRGQALTYLQRALLVQDLNQLTAIEWEACFNKVLFPLLSILLENPAISELSGIEETRFRASTLLSKVYLQHLQALLDLSTFTALWLTILDFMDKYMHADQSDQLMEGIPELLKNMLLVMGGMDIFYEPDSSPKTETQLCRLTCDRLNSFLPALKQEIFAVESTPPPQSVALPQGTTPVQTAPQAMHPLANNQSVPVTQNSDLPKPADPVADSTPDQPADPVIASEPVRADSPSLPPAVTTPPPQQTKAPGSPDLIHNRPTSPLVHGIIPSTFTVKLHPPLAPPASMAPPTLVPVNTPPYTSVSPASSPSYGSLPTAADVFYTPPQSHPNNAAGAAGNNLLFGPHIVRHASPLSTSQDKPQ